MRQLAILLGTILSYEWGWIGEKRSRIALAIMALLALGIGWSLAGIAYEGVLWLAIWVIASLLIHRAQHAGHTRP